MINDRVIDLIAGNGTQRCWNEIKVATCYRPLLLFGSGGGWGWGGSRLRVDRYAELSNARNAKMERKICPNISAMGIP
jgi:hypothetical protein